MWILGISAYFHDSAAALVHNGEVVCAFQEERFTRVKHDNGFPENAILACLSFAKIKGSDIGEIVFYDKPLLKFERLLETYLGFMPKGFASFRKAMPVWLTEKLFARDLLAKALKNIGFAGIKGEKILFSEHHLSHAASAFYPSPYPDAAILVMDGAGEWSTTSIAQGRGNEIKILKEIHFPHSLGLLYSAFTYYCGFRVNSGEYKLMGLAPYGEPKYTELIKENLIDLRADGSYHLNMAYFNYATGLTMTGKRFSELFGAPARAPESDISNFYKDIAASIQKVTEEAVANLAKHALQIAGSKNLCLAGGVALNCVANGMLLRNKIASNIWVQPASGDAGGALGAALAVHYIRNHGNRESISADTMQGAYLGNGFSEREIEKELMQLNAHYELLNDGNLIQKTAAHLAEGKAIGWFQDRMEFGPRALGNRSVLADPRGSDMQQKLNLKIKFRESFRPFAPIVLEERASDFFELTSPSPYMLVTAQVRPEKAGFLPAVTHVDGSARVQTVNKNSNEKLHALLTEFNHITGCPVLINTSFNVRGEPMVQSVRDAYRCFMSNDLDVLVIGNYWMSKDHQPLENKVLPALGED